MAMEFDWDVVEREDKRLTVAFKNENETLLNLLKQRLLRNDAIETASYVIGHPLVDVPKLVIVASSGKPEQHLRAAAKEIRAELDAFDTQFLKQAK